MTLGAKLHALRSAKGLSLRQVEAGSGVPFSTIHRIESDKVKPFVGTMGALCRFYGVQFTDLIEDPPEMTDEETDAFLIGRGYDLEKLRTEINALIDKLREQAKAILLAKEQA